MSSLHIETTDSKVERQVTDWKEGFATEKGEPPRGSSQFNEEKQKKRRKMGNSYNLSGL